MKKKRLPIIVRLLFLNVLLAFSLPAVGSAAGYPNAAPGHPLPTVHYNGETLVNPAATPVSVDAGHLRIQPVLTVEATDRGQTASLFIYIYLPQARTGFSFSAPRPVTLGEEADFSAVFPRMIDMTDANGAVLDIYCAYGLTGNRIRYNAYEVTIGDGEVDDSFDSRAATQLDRYLQAGDSPATALGKLSTALVGNPEVVGTVATADQNGLWVVGKSGEQVLLEVETLDEPPSGTITSSTEESVTEGMNHLSASRPAGRLMAEPLSPFDYIFPATNKALLLNSLKTCVPEIGDSGYDTTKAVASYLKRIGYEIKRSSGTLNDFTSLTDDYSVIFIEARTSRQSGGEIIKLLSERPILPSQNPTNADIDGNSEALNTSTIVTPVLRRQYADDLRFGRLKIRHPWYKFRGKTYRCKPTFAVTPNFIRQHCKKGRFPNHTLLYISAGGLIGDTLTSQWQTLLAGKSDNCHFLTWGGKPKFVSTQLAAANLFQLLTGMDYRFTVTIEPTTFPNGQTIVEDHIEDHPVQPPMVNMNLSKAWGYLSMAGGVFDMDSGATLLTLDHGPQTEMHPYFALAPVLDDFYLDQLGKAYIFGAAPPGSQARFFDSTGNSIDDFDKVFNLGDHSYPPYEEPMMFGECYHFDLPVSVAGTLELRDPQGRHSTGMIVYIWKPRLDLLWHGNGGENYSVAMQLVARALLAPRWRVLTKDLNDPYSPPRDNSINGRFDSTASLISWTVTGEKSDGQSKVSYHGNGSASILFKDKNGWLESADFTTSDDGENSLIFYVGFGQIKLTFTETRTEGGTSTDKTRTIPLTGLYLENIAIDPKTLTIKPGEQTITDDEGDTVKVRWGEAKSSPSYWRYIYTGAR